MRSRGSREKNQPGSAASQDVPHRINAASASAEQLRVSLVLKLVFLPKQGADRQLSGLARPEWGPAVRFGSAAGPASAAAAS